MASTKRLRVLGFAGSLRKGSFNKLLLEAAVHHAPDQMCINTHSLGGLPLFNQDIEQEEVPLEVIEFKQAIADADGLLVVTPEYNFGTSAVTKNALDWASRSSHPGNVLAGKPLSIMGVSGGTTGNTSMARMAVRQTVLYPGALPMPYGDIGLGGGSSNFDQRGDLREESVRQQVTNALMVFADWIELVQGSRW